MSAASGRSSIGLLIVLIAAVLVIGGLVRAGIVRVPGHPVFRPEKIALQLATNVTPIALANFKNGFASVIDPDLPAVVNISSSKIVKQQTQVPSPFSDPFFRQFFGNGNPPQQAPENEREYSLGSGVIINPDGFVLTNNHVVDGGADIEVFTQNRRKYKAQVIGTDPQTDIAVLKIDATGLPVLTLGDSSHLQVGDLVFAIGDPFGIGETATTGIVSATGRALGGSIEHYEDFIQTDAAINPGNSGGALIDLHGDLIGINTAIIAGNGGGNEGIGFAIPIDMARNVLEQIVEHGKVTRGYLGVTIQQVNSDMAHAFGLQQGGGALVGDLAPNGPAAKAGLQRGDVILELDGQKISGPDDLSVRISEMQPGTVAHLLISRMGQTHMLDVTLGEFPEKGQGSQQQGAPATPTTLQGVQVQNLSPDVTRQLNLPAGIAGVVVTNVDPSSPAAGSLQMGDVIQEVNRTPVHNVNEFQQALAATGKQPVLLLVNRQGTTEYVLIQPQG